MKKNVVRMILAAACSGLLAVSGPAAGVQAETIKLASGNTVSTVKVSGTITRGTTSSLLLLTASEGTYRCKMDSDTDFNGLTSLVIGNAATIEVYNGSDGYLHVAKFDSSGAASSSSSSTSSSTSTSSSGTSSGSTTGTSAASQSGTAVAGTIRSNTTNSMLYLSTEAGDMTIKIDSDCDLTQCGTLIAGNIALVTVYRGSDAYMHASKIISGANGVDLNNLLTVSGTVTSSTTNSMIYLSTSTGTYQLKWDTATDLDISGVLYAGKEVTAVIGRGSDAYFHAVKISDGTKSQSTGTSQSTDTSSGTAAKEVNTVTVSGGITTDSDEGTIYISTSNGTFKVLLDKDTDYTACPVMVAKYSVKAEIYIGDDSEYHAKKITDLSSNGQGNADGVDASSAVEVTGTVKDGTKQNLLVLNWNGNEMQIKIDTKTDLKECRVLKPGIKVTVKVARGSDAYLHATSIVNNSSAGGSSSNLGDDGMLTGQETTPVSGTIQSGSSEDYLILHAAGEDYRIRLDSGCDMSNCKVLIPGNSCRAYIYKGSDSKLHAARLIDLSSSYPGNAGSLDASTKVTIEGTVSSGTTIGLLNLNMNGGVMKVKIDQTTDTTKCRVLSDGKKVSVVVERGSDAYLHALSITAK